MFGHSLMKPFFNAFIRLEIFELHRDWWANFTPMARVLMEWVNATRSMGVVFF